MSTVKNLSANALQLVLNQTCGMVTFFVLSAGLDKPAFGQLNFVLAVLLSGFGIFSFGLDQVLARQIAEGARPHKVMPAHRYHVRLWGGISFVVLLLAGEFWGEASEARTLLIGIGAGKLLLFLATPYKQVTAGLEKFSVLAMMQVISNLFRAATLTLLLFTGRLTTGAVIGTFIAGDALEWLVTRYLYEKNIGSNRGQLLRGDYRRLVRSSLPQLGVVIIAAVLARFDWLYIGLTSSQSRLAEYSFAYKIFELASFPLLVIAPTLIPRFTRKYSDPTRPSHIFSRLLAGELIIACCSAALLNLVWNPAVDLLTHHRYGRVNTTTIFLLSLCLPLLYLNNYLWTTCFAQKRLSLIFLAFVVTLLVNVAGNVVLIPHYGNDGAAAAYLAAMLAQSAFYLWRSPRGRATNAPAPSYG